MAIVNLGTQSFSGGGSVVNLVFDVTTRQLPARQEPDRVVIGKPLPGADLGVSTIARFSVRGATPNHLFGIKQIASIRFHTTEYSGLKNIDGSITEGTSGLNRTLLLDVTPQVDAATLALSAPYAPFYSENPSLIRPGVQVELRVKDSPGGSYPFEKRNHVTDRLNFLDATHEVTDFLTFLVVRLPNSSHFAIAGFRWTFSASLQVRWDKAIPTASGSAKHEFQTSATRSDLTQAEIAVLDNPRLTFADCILVRINRAMTAANAAHVASPLGPGAVAKIEGGGYAIDQFDHFNNFENQPKLQLFRL